jgi:hypothetical protein
MQQSPPLVKFQIYKIESKQKPDDEYPDTINSVASYANYFDSEWDAENALRQIEFPGTFTILKIFIQAPPTTGSNNQV